MSGAFLGSLLAPAGESEHGSDYQRARQQYLRTLAADLNQPRHVRGWAMQEDNRLQRIAAARAAGRGAPGGDPYRYKGMPGYDVGHKLGKHGQHQPANFRLEWARDNRARPGYARRLGVQNRWRESELEAELELAAEVLQEAERFDGRGTNRALERLDSRLIAAAGTNDAIRYNQGQADAAGNRVMAGRNPTKPDLAYLTRWNGGDLRVNVEVDTDPQRALRHLAGNRVQDPRALSYALITHPETGRILGGRVYDPRYRNGVERRLSRREINNLSAGTVGRHGLPVPNRQTRSSTPVQRTRPVKAKHAQLFNIRRK